MPDIDLNTFDIFLLIGLAATLAAFLYMVATQKITGSAALAAALAAGFGAFSLVTLYAEGLPALWANHAVNLWGVQVWWDLLLAAGLAFFLLASRARAAGMNVPLWAVFTLCTASIGLLAMAARLFWLERNGQEAADGTEQGAAEIR